MGLAFKQDIDDLRESPALQVINVLILDDKYELILVEPYLDDGSEYKLAECSEAISKADIIAYLVAHKEFKGFRNKENISLDFCEVKC